MPVSMLEAVANQGLQELQWPTRKHNPIRAKLFTDTKAGCVVKIVQLDQANFVRASLIFGLGFFRMFRSTREIVREVQYVKYRGYEHYRYKIED